MLSGPLLDNALGDAARIAELDATAAFPAEQCAALDAAGLPAYYVPPEWGGKLDDHEVLLRLWRDVARRDLSTIVAHGKTYLGTACVWLAGSEDQASAVAKAVLGGVPAAWALSEPGHGADLLNGSLTATESADGWRLTGAKWPINNATRADLLTVLARTGTAGSARGQSLFLVDKSTLAPGTWQHRRKAATHGIRGVDISGIAFDGARADLLGAQGTGVETVLRALQLTRTMCGGLSLGAGEHALRLTGRFVSTRVIQRKPLIDRAQPRSVLARCAGLLAAAEAAALVGARSIHGLTGEMSVASAIVKSVVPALTDLVIADLTELLGARSYLTDVYEYGAFQKLARDHQIVSVFDGSTPVNRSALAQQFPRLARAYAAETVDGSGLAEAVDIGVRPSELDRGELVLASRNGCSVVQSLPGVVAALSEPELTAMARSLLAITAKVVGLMAEVRPAARPAMAAYELAAAYELCYVGAACLHLWTAENDVWLRVALHAVLTRLTAVLRMPAPEPVDHDPLAELVADAAMTGGAITPFGAGDSRGH
ncbi:acyl-CoA dehydrogenase family protein [Kutzneria sp. 744]|uniref:acyl-CoA dehydrogenase family protein n=1 Tax=Kutzneria sp. (strain 744) TaxID=345341 RepID=UPI0003EEC32C|nr:acyl-CoA dehydrogenase [Kutzneria sp. 744]EWM10367.1 acyl-CoA dehydrogenase [Kutzneria sp. 744]